MKEIGLSRGMVATVDDDIFEELSQHKWTVMKGTSTWYAYRKERRGERLINIYMHRQIMDTPPGMDTDHQDRNGLHNWRGNLRVCTRTQNRANSIKTRGTSRFKGVVWDKGAWQAKITIHGVITYLGRFGNDEIAAALAYDVAALEHFGEFARLNFPQEMIGTDGVLDNL